MKLFSDLLCGMEEAVDFQDEGETFSVFQEEEDGRGTIRHHLIMDDDILRQLYVLRGLDLPKAA